jgi:hypothetical protein
MCMQRIVRTLLKNLDNVVIDIIVNGILGCNVALGLVGKSAPVNK